MIACLSRSLHLSRWLPVCPLQPMAAPSAMVPVSDELLALSAIYGDELTLHPPPPLSFTLRLCPTLSLTVTLSDAYPSNPPSFTLQRLADSSFSDAEVEAVRGRGEAVVRESEGEEGYCYQLIEAMREEATDIEERRRRAEASALRPPAADCRTAHSTITLPDDNEDEWEAEYEHDAPEDAAEEWQRRKLARLSLQPATPATEQVPTISHPLPPSTISTSLPLSRQLILSSCCPRACSGVSSHLWSAPHRSAVGVYCSRRSPPLTRRPPASPVPHPLPSQALSRHAQHVRVPHLHAVVHAERLR